MNLSRFQVAINHDDPDLVSQGLRLFRERVLADHAATSSFGYHGRPLGETSSGSSSDGASASSVGGRGPEEVTGLLAAYLAASPVMEELFVLWALPGRDEDLSLVQAHTHCLAAILHCLQGDTAATSRIVARILTDFSKSLIAQLGVNNQGVQHSTIGLLLAICRSSEQNCRDCYHRVIGHTTQVNHLLQKGKEVQFSLQLPDDEQPDGVDHEDQPRRKIATDSRYLMCMLVLVLVLHADNEIAQEVLTAYGGRSLLSRVMNGLPHDPPHTVGLICRGLSCLLKTPTVPAAFKFQLLDSSSLQKLLQLHEGRGNGDAMGDLLAATLTSYAVEVAAGLRGGGGGGFGSGSAQAKAHMLIRFVHPHVQPALATTLQPLLVAKPSLLASCVTALSAAPGVAWDALNFCETHLAALNRLCQILETTAIDSSTKQNVAAILDNKKSDQEIKAFVTSLVKSFLPSGFSKKEFSKLLFEPTNPLLQRMGLLLFQNIINRLGRCTRDAISGTHSSSSAVNGLSKLLVYLLSVATLYLPDIQLVFALRARYLKVLMDTRRLVVSGKSEDEVTEKQAQSIYFTQLSLSVLESVLKTLPTMITVQSNYNITKLLDEITWVIKDVVPDNTAEENSKLLAVESANALDCILLVEKTLQVLFLATKENQCKWFGQQAEVVKVLVNTLVTASWGDTQMHGCMLGGSSSSKHSPFARLLYLCTDAPYMNMATDCAAENLSEVRVASESIQCLSNSLLALIFQQSGLFQGHGATDLEMAAERSGWLNVVRSLAGVSLDGHHEDSWACILRSRYLIHNVDTKNQATFDDKTNNNETQLIAMVSVLDVVFRLAFHWNTELAMLAHSAVVDTKDLSKDRVAALFYKSVSPFSPVLYAVLSLLRLDFSVMMSSFPSHVKTHVLARQAGESVETDSNFLTNFQCNVHSSLVPMFDKIILELLPWTPQPFHLMHALGRATALVGGNTELSSSVTEMIQRRIAVYAALSSHCSVQTKKTTRRRTINGNKKDNADWSPDTLDTLIQEEANCSQGNGQFFFASRNLCFCVHNIEKFVDDIALCEDGEKISIGGKVFSHYWANISATLCSHVKRFQKLSMDGTFSKKLISWVRNNLRKEVASKVDSASFEGKLSFMSFCLRLLFDIEDLCCDSTSYTISKNSAPEPKNLIQTRKRTRASSIVSNDSVASSVASVVPNASTSSSCVLEPGTITAAQELCDDLVAVVVQVVTSTAASPLTLSTLYFKVSSLTKHFTQNSGLGRRCLQILCATSRVHADRRVKKNRKLEAVHPLWTEVSTILKKVDFSSCIDDSSTVIFHESGAAESDEPNVSSLRKLCWNLQNIIEDAGLREKLIDVVVDTSTGHTLTSVVSSRKVGPVQLSVLKSASIQSLQNALHSLLSSGDCVGGHDSIGDNALTGIVASSADTSPVESSRFMQMEYFCEIMSLINPSSIFDPNLYSPETISAKDSLDKYFLAKLVLSLSPAAKGLVLASISRLDYVGDFVKFLLAMELSHLCALPLESVNSISQKHSCFTKQWLPKSNWIGGNNFVELVDVMLAHQIEHYSLDKKTRAVINSLKDLLLLLMQEPENFDFVVNVFSAWLHISSTSNTNANCSEEELQKFKIFVSTVLVPVTLFHCVSMGSIPASIGCEDLSAQWHRTLCTTITLLSDCLAAEAKVLSEVNPSGIAQRFTDVVHGLETIWLLPVYNDDKEHHIFPEATAMQKCTDLLNKTLKTCLKFGLNRSIALNYIHHMYRMSNQFGPCAQFEGEEQYLTDETSPLGRICCSSGEGIIPHILILEMMVGHSKFADTVYTIKGDSSGLICNPLLRLLLFLLGLCKTGLEQHNAQDDDNMDANSDEEDNEAEAQCSDTLIADDEKFLPHESKQFLIKVLLNVYCGTMAETDRLIVRILSSLEPGEEYSSDGKKRGNAKSSIHGNIYSSTPDFFCKSKDKSLNQFRWVTSALKPPLVYSTLAQFPNWRGAIPQPMFFEDATRFSAHQTKQRIGLYQVSRGQKKYEAQERAREEERMQYEKERRLQRQRGREDHNPFSRANILRREEEQWFAGSTPETTSAKHEDDDSDSDEDDNVTDHDDLLNEDDMQLGGNSERESEAGCFSSIKIDRLHRATGAAAVQVLDPTYWIPSIYFCLHMNPELSMRIFANSGALSMLLAALSCECKLLRSYALAALQIVIEQLRKQTPDKDSTFRERPQLLVIVSFIRNAIGYTSLEDSEENGDTGGDDPAPTDLSLHSTVPMTSAIFMGRAALHVLQPQHPLFSSINKYLLSRPFLDVKDIPLYDLLVIYSDVESDGDERLAALRLLRDSLGSHEDHINMCRKNAYGRLLVYFTLFVHDVNVLHAVLDVMEKAMSQQASSRYLLERCALLTWLQQVISPISSNSFALSNVGDQSKLVHTQSSAKGGKSGCLAAPVRLLSRCVMLLRRTLRSLLLLSRGDGVKIMNHLRHVFRVTQVTVQEVILIGKGNLNTEASLPFDFFYQLVCVMWEVSTVMMSLQRDFPLWHCSDLQKLAQICLTTYEHSTGHHKDSDALVYSILLLRATCKSNLIENDAKSSDSQWSEEKLLSVSGIQLIPTVRKNNTGSGNTGYCFLLPKSNVSMATSSVPETCNPTSSILFMLADQGPLTPGSLAAMEQAGSCLDTMALIRSGQGGAELQATLKESINAAWLGLADQSFGHGHNELPLPLSIGATAALTLTTKSILVSLLSKHTNGRTASSALRFTRWALVIKKCYVDDDSLYDRGDSASQLLALCYSSSGDSSTNYVRERLCTLLDLVLVAALPLLQVTDAGDKVCKYPGDTIQIVIRQVLTSILRAFSCPIEMYNGITGNPDLRDLLLQSSKYLFQRGAVSINAASCCCQLLEALCSLLSAIVTSCDRDAQWCSAVTDTESDSKSAEERHTEILDSLMLHVPLQGSDGVLNELLNDRVTFLHQCMEDLREKFQPLEPPSNSMDCCDSGSCVSLWCERENQVALSQHSKSASNFKSLISSGLSDSSRFRKDSGFPSGSGLSLNKATGRASKADYHRGRALLLRSMKEACEQQQLQQRQQQPISGKEEGEDRSDEEDDGDDDGEVDEGESDNEDDDDDQLEQENGNDEDDDDVLSSLAHSSKRKSSAPGSKNKNKRAKSERS